MQSACFPNVAHRSGQAPRPRAKQSVMGREAEDPGGKCELARPPLEQSFCPVPSIVDGGGAPVA